jgi:hypothetical protein
VAVAGYQPLEASNDIWVALALGSTLCNAGTCAFVPTYATDGDHVESSIRILVAYIRLTR